MPPLFWFVLGFVSWPILTNLYRLFPAKVLHIRIDKRRREAFISHARHEKL